MWHYWDLYLGEFSGQNYNYYAKREGKEGKREESIDSQPSDGRQTFDRNGEGRRKKE